MSLMTLPISRTRMVMSKQLCNWRMMLKHVRCGILSMSLFQFLPKFCTEYTITLSLSLSHIYIYIVSLVKTGSGQIEFKGIK